MSKVTYELDDNVAVLTMDSGENRFNFTFFETMNKALDEIEQQTEANALVVTSAHEKIWSNGIDLEWLGPAAEKGGPQLRQKFMGELFSLMKRILVYPMLTVAAINGHAFAGGAFMSFAHDFRFMRSDRGWICLPEVDLGMTLGPVFMALCRRAIPTYIFEEMQFLGARLTAQECEEHHIIRKACTLDELMDEVVAFAKSLNKPREIISRMKVETHKEITAIIENSIASVLGSQ